MILPLPLLLPLTTNGFTSAIYMKVYLRLWMKSLTVTYPVLEFVSQFSPSTATGNAFGVQIGCPNRNNIPTLIYASQFIYSSYNLYVSLLLLKEIGISCPLFKIAIPLKESIFAICLKLIMYDL